MNRARKKVLWLSHLIPYPPTGGVLQRSHNLIREVSKVHDVYLASFVQGALVTPFFNTKNEGVKISRGELLKFCKDVVYVDIPSESSKFKKLLLIISSFFSTRPYTIRWLESEEMCLALKKWEKDYDFDLIYMDTISLYPYRELMPSDITIMNHHNIESDMMITRAKKEKNIFKALYFYMEGVKLNRYEKRNLPNITLNITCSILDSQRLKKVSPNVAVEEIPNGVDLEFFEPDRSNVKKDTLIFAGGLNWYPNRDAMLLFSSCMWSRLKILVPGVVMNVVGKYPPDELVRLSKVDDNFKVHGFVGDIKSHMNSAAVYVCPIRDGGGTKLKLLDALAMKIPIVASRISCEGIDVEDKVHLLMADTEKDQVNAIAELLANSGMRKELAENGRRLVEKKYSFKKIGAKLSNIISSVV